MLAVDYVAQTFALLTTLIATAGAIGGGVLGSFLTYKHARAIEEQKRLAQKEEENQFNARIRAIVRTELLLISASLDGVSPELDAFNFEQKVDEYTSQFYEREYPKMSLERRASAFSPELLPIIEQSYQAYAMFTADFKHRYHKYQNGTITFQELKSTLSRRSFDVKQLIDAALKLLGDTLETIS